MSDNERELINIIRESEDPGLAAFASIKVFVAFLESLGAAQELPAADQQESA